MKKSKQEKLLLLTAAALTLTTAYYLNNKNLNVGKLFIMSSIVFFLSIYVLYKKNK